MRPVGATSKRPDFGLDAPWIVGGYAALALVGVVLIVVSTFVSVPTLLGWGIWALVVGVIVAGAMLYSSRVGKIRVRDRLLDRMDLRGGEDVLDLGCGSGLMLLGAAQRLTTGTATGIDLWRSVDQAGSTPDRCRDNARRLGVTDRITLVDGDMTDLPFPDASFDLVTACLSIHNLHPDARREQTIREAARVLRPGGRLAIIDMAGTKIYMSAAAAAGLTDVRRTRYVAHMFPPCRMLTAVAPAGDV